MLPIADQRAVPAAHAAFARALSAGRLVLGLVAALAAVTASSWSDPLPTDVAALVVGIALVVSAREAIRWRCGRSDVPDRAMIVVDAALGVTLLVTLGGSAGIVGWIALVVPVAEALVWTGAAAATLTWVAMAGSFVVLSVMAGSSMDVVLLDLLRHVGGSTLVAVPVGAAGSILGRDITRADRTRILASRRADALLRVGLAGRRISSASDADGVLTAVVESSLAVGFEAADLSVFGTDGKLAAHKVGGRFDNGVPSAAPGGVAGRAEFTDPVADAQLLHRHGFDNGTGYAADVDGTRLSLRVWRTAPAPDGLDDGELLEILSNQGEVAWRQVTAHQDLSRRASDLAHDATHDALTGLANRNGLLEYLEALCRSDTGGVALLFIDLDGFKAVNDDMGHDAGDRVLRLAADRITSAVGSGFVGRLGGDEFVASVPATTAQDAAVVGSRIVVALEVPMQVGDRSVLISGSVGVSIVDHSLGVSEILRRADRAMYAAKRAGGGRVAAVRD